MRMKNDTKKYENKNYTTRQITSALAKSVSEYNSIYGMMDIKTFVKDKRNTRIVRDFVREFYEIGKNYDENYLNNSLYVNWDQLKELRNLCVHNSQNLHNSYLLTESQKLVKNISKQLVNNVSFDSNYLNNEICEFKKNKHDSKIFKTTPQKKQSEQKQMCKMVKPIKDFYSDIGRENNVNLIENHFYIRLIRDYINELYIMSQSLDLYHKKSSTYIDWNKFRKFRNRFIHETINIDERKQMIIGKNFVNYISKQFIHDLVYDVGFEKIDFQIQGLSPDIFPEIDVTLAEYDLDQVEEFIDLD